MDLSSFISSSKHRAFSRYSATKLELLLVGSLKLAFSRTGLLKLKVKTGIQMDAFLGWSPLASLGVPIDVDFLDCPFLVQASLSGG